MQSTGKRKLFIHIGPLKTGSSSIQGMLHRLSPALEMLGVHVLATSAVRARHHLVPKRGLGGRPPMHAIQGVWRALHKEVRQCGSPRMVISSEFLSGAVVGAMARPPFLELARTTGIDVEVIACVRPQWQWLESRWAEYVGQMAVVPPFAEWLKRQLDDQAPDYLRMLDPWKAAFGKVTVIPLERSRLPNGLLHRFLEVLGVDDARLLTAVQGMDRRNVRLSAKQLALLHLLTNALHRHGLDREERQRARNRLGDTAALFDDNTPFAPLSREGIDAIRARFSRANARLAREYGLDAGTGLFRNELADDWVRPSMAGWEAYTDAERQRVRDRVRRRLGLTLPDGHPVAGEGRASHGQAPSRRIKAKLASSGGGVWLPAGGRAALDLLRGFAHLRMSAQGRSILRWWRWQAHGIAHRALHALRGEGSVPER